MDGPPLWNLVPASCYVLLVALTLLFLLGVRKEPSIQFRNPQILFVCAVGTTFNSFFLWRALYSPSSTCHIEYFSCYSEYSLLVFPLTLRGCQYIVLTNDHYRRKCPSFKSNIFVFKCCAIFFILNSCTMEVFYWTFYRFSCTMTWDAIYAVVLLFVLVFFTSKVSSQISWNADKFKIGKELKICYRLWAIFGLLVIGSALGKKHLGNFTKYPYVFIIVLNIATFLLIIVAPLLRSQVFQRITRKFCGQVDSNLIPFNMKRSKLEHGTTKTISVRPMESFKYDQLCLLLEHTFEDQNSVKKLHDFTACHFAQEISLFLHAVHNYKTAVRTGQQNEVRDLYDKIINDFIKINSPYEINVSSDVRSKILAFNASDDKVTPLEQGELEVVFDQAHKDMSDLFQKNLGAAFCDCFLGKNTTK